MVKQFGEGGIRLINMYEVLECQRARGEAWTGYEEVCDGDTERVIGTWIGGIKRSRMKDLYFYSGHSPIRETLGTAFSFL